MIVLEGTDLLYTQNIIRISREECIMIRKYELYAKAKMTFGQRIHGYLIKTVVFIEDKKI